MNKTITTAVGALLLGVVLTIIVYSLLPTRLEKLETKYKETYNSLTVKEGEQLVLNGKMEVLERDVMQLRAELETATCNVAKEKIVQKLDVSMATIQMCGLFD